MLLLFTENEEEAIALLDILEVFLPPFVVVDDELFPDFFVEVVDFVSFVDEFSVILLVVVIVNIVVCC